MNYSLILPSRERLGLLENLLDSVVLTTENINEIEMWVAFDWDDKPSIKSIKRLNNKYSFVQFLVTDRQNNLSTGYYNRLAQISSGKYIQILNDDCKFVTSKWDTLALPVLEKYQKIHKDGLLYGRVLDDLNTGYSCFPLLSREAVEHVGWVFHPEFAGWGADIHIHQMYSIIGRILEIPYFIEHISHHTGKRERDHINERLGIISKYNFESVKGEANRVKNIIKSLEKKYVIF